MKWMILEGEKERKEKTCRGERRRDGEGEGNCMKRRKGGEGGGNRKKKRSKRNGEEEIYVEVGREEKEELETIGKRRKGR